MTQWRDTSINRNIMECKADLDLRLHIMPDNRINRNIMECKVEGTINAYKQDNSINRNIMECKVRQIMVSLC